MQTWTERDMNIKNVQVNKPNLDNLAENFDDRIELLIDIAGSGSEFARKCKVSNSVVAKWRRGETDPSRKRLLAIAKAFDVDLYWLLDGIGEMHPYRLESKGDPRICTYNNLQESMPVVRLEQQQDAEITDDWNDFSLIPVYDVQASAGHGSLVESELQTGQLAFKKSWLKEKGLQVGHLAIITAKGDSMEQTICDGDTLLVDTRVDKIIDDSIYIVQADHHLIVKRLQQDFDGSVFVISDNPRYEKRHLNPEQAKNLKIAGRVCWYGHEI